MTTDARENANKIILRLINYDESDIIQPAKEWEIEEIKKYKAWLKLMRGERD